MLGSAHDKLKTFRQVREKQYILYPFKKKIAHNKPVQFKQTRMESEITEKNKSGTQPGRDTASGVVGLAT